MSLRHQITSIIIISPTLLQREAWQALLSNQPQIQVIEAISDVEALEKLTPLTHPTTILLDCPTLRLDVVRQAVSHAPGCGVVVLAQDHLHEDMVSLLQVGASGCVSRNDSLAHLASSIIAAGRGEVIIPVKHAPAVLASLAERKASASSPADALSERETDVLRLLAQGLTNKETA